MNKQIIRSIFTEILENPVMNKALISKYFTTDYVQYVDGKIINFDDFVKHIQVLKTKIKQMSISMKSIVAEDNIVFTNHEVTTIMHGGRNGKMKVIAEFRLRDGKVYYCDELTHMLEGDNKDKDLGSRVD